MTYLAGPKAVVRALRAAMNRAGSVRGVTYGGPDCVPTELDADGLAPGWTSPAAGEVVEVGLQALVELADDLPAELFDGKAGRPTRAALVDRAALPVALQARLDALDTARVTAGKLA